MVFLRGAICKYSALGNDFLICERRRLPTAERVKKECENGGVDGFIVVKNPGTTPEMVIFNADGSRAETCGNGLRCVAAFCHEKGVNKHKFTIKTDGQVGCGVMGPGKFSIKVRLGVDRNDELLKFMPMINEFPLRFLTVHARTARQMYAGVCDAEGLKRVTEVSKVPLVFNGDIPFPPDPSSPIPDPSSLMIGRSFIRYLGTREDSGELLRRYIAASQAELCGDRPVLGRMKELIAYWKDLPRWKRRWNVIKLCRTVDELKSCLL